MTNVCAVGILVVALFHPAMMLGADRQHQAKRPEEIRVIRTPSFPKKPGGIFGNIILIRSRREGEAPAEPGTSGHLSRAHGSAGASPSHTIHVPIER